MDAESDLNLKKSISMKTMINSLGFQKRNETQNLETLCKILNSCDLWIEVIPRKVYFTDLYMILK